MSYENSIAFLGPAGTYCNEAALRFAARLGIDDPDLVECASFDEVFDCVDDGTVRFGVVGKDTIMENGSHFFEILDLGFGRCRFALACKKGVDFFSGYRAKTVATKYPNIARQFFESRAMDVRIIKIEGSVELAPLLGLADGIVDIVETGATLRENGLEVVETITQISARLIANTASLKLRKAEIESLAARLERSIAESRGEKTV